MFGHYNQQNHFIHTQKFIFLQYQLIQSQFDLHKIKLKKISKIRLHFFTFVWKATKVLLPALIKVVSLCLLTCLCPTGRTNSRVAPIYEFMICAKKAQK